MANYYEDACPSCTGMNDITELVCNHCGITIPTPINVRRASLPQEKQELEKRYTSAQSHLASNGLTTEGINLENAIKTNGKAVLNTQFHFLIEWLVENKAAYESYRRQVFTGARMKARFENDGNRSKADSILFGSEINIIYAALSVDESGVMSYGDVTVVLNTGSVEKRSSALERNSFPFIDDATAKGWTWKQPLPCGFMAVWPDFFKLSLSKLYLHLHSGISFSQLAKLVLDSAGTRAGDEFIELYIYGKIVASTVEKIKIPITLTTGLNPKQKLKLEELKRKYKVEIY